jgi:hypothetical protein
MVADEALISVFNRLARSRGCSVDDILETPELREEYLSESRHVVGDLPEQQLLHRLVYLRKRSKLPRSRDLE